MQAEGITHLLERSECEAERGEAQRRSARNASGGRLEIELAQQIEASVAALAAETDAARRSDIFRGWLKGIHGVHGGAG